MSEPVLSRKAIGGSHPVKEGNAGGRDRVDDICFFFLFFYLAQDKTMQQPASQTAKSSWWSITAYGDELEYLLALQGGTAEFPPQVKAIYGGVEECPKTQRLHFQGALNTAQVRFSAVKRILPKSHIEACRSDAESLKRYAMKDETSVGQKSSQTNPKYYTLESLMLKIAETFVEQLNEEWSIITDNDDHGYHDITRTLLKREYLFLCNLCSQPQSVRCWKLYYYNFITAYKECRDEVSET